MVKTFYAVEVTVFAVTADVNEHDVALNGGRDTTREELSHAYNGSFTKGEAMQFIDAFTKRAGREHMR